MFLQQNHVRQYFPPTFSPNLAPNLEREHELWWRQCQNLKFRALDHIFRLYVVWFDVEMNVNAINVSKTSPMHFTDFSPKLNSPQHLDQKNKNKNPKSSPTHP